MARIFLKGKGKLKRTTSFPLILMSKLHWLVKTSKCAPHNLHAINFFILFP
jgi:hypothetical protein